jgi:amino acid permease
MAVVTEKTPLVSSLHDGSSNQRDSRHHNEELSVTFAVAENGRGPSPRRVREGGVVRQLSDRLIVIIAHHTGSIGWLGSMSIAVNSLTGPAMVNLPATFARSGVIPTIGALVFVCFLSSFCSMHMSNTISKVAGNHNFKKEIEFSEAFRAFWGHRWFLVTQVIFFCCITCLNISSIVDTGEVVDTFFGHWWPRGSGAFQISGSGDTHWIRWDYSICSEEQLHQGECIPFHDDPGTLITVGKVVTTIIFLPLALMDLKENAAWQILGFAILIVTSLQFIIQFGMSGIDFNNVSLWGSDWDDLLGVVLFNFALVIAIPAWLYEREPHVNVPTVIHGSTILSTSLYICIGLLGNLAIPNVSQNMLESMMSGIMGSFMQIGASIFAFAIIGLGIPLFSVLTRLNLTGSGLCSRRTGNILAVYFPFTISLLVNDAGDVTKLLSWGGVVFTSLVAFILPLLLALHVVKHYEDPGSITVYFGLLESKSAHLCSLRVLLFLAITSVTIAIVGNFV